MPLSYSGGFVLSGGIAPVTPPAPVAPPVNIVYGVPTWRFVLVQTNGTPIGELTAAKGKSVIWPLNDVASASFTIDGTHPQALLPMELQTDLIVYDPAGNKRFRGRMGTSSDAIAANGHVTTFSAVDYRGYFARRLLRDTATMAFINADQGDIAWQLISDSQAQLDSTSLITRGAYGETGVLRSFTFAEYAKIADLINQMANVDDGFDWEIDGDLVFNVYYPERGNVTALVLEYGGTVLSAARTADTTTFANFIAESGTTGLTPVEVQSDTIGVEGLWESAVGDTSILDQTTLTIKAEYDLSTDQVLVPSYQLVLKVGWWTPEDLWLGDTALVVVRSGRINDIGTQRITQIEVDINDDGGEVVTLTTGPVPQDEGRALDNALNRIAILETLS